MRQIYTTPCQIIRSFPDGSFSFSQRTRYVGAFRILIIVSNLNAVLDMIAKLSCWIDYLANILSQMPTLLKSLAALNNRAKKNITIISFNSKPTKII